MEVFFFEDNDGFLIFSIKSINEIRASINIFNNKNIKMGAFCCCCPVDYDNDLNEPYKNYSPSNKPGSSRKSSKELPIKVICVGQTGVGKSSLLNYLYQLNLPTGMGGITERISLVKILHDKIQIYDSSALPAISVFADRNAQEKLRPYLSDFTKIFVIYEASLKNVQQFIKLADQKNKNLIFLRSKCDLFSKSSKKTLEAEIESDKLLLTKWGIKNIKIYAVTADPKSENQFDTRKMLQQISAA